MWTGDGPKDISLFGAAVGVPVEACGELGDRVLLLLPVGPGGLGEVARVGFACAGPLNIAEHVRKVQVGHHHRFQGLAVRGSWVALQCPNASPAR